MSGLIRIAIFIFFWVQIVLAEPLTVGVILPLTGPIPSVGEAIKNTIQLADHELDKDNKVKFIFEDDAFVPRNSIAAVTKLINIDRIQALIIFGSTTTLAVAGIVEAKKIPTVSISTAADAVKNKKYIVRHLVSGEAEGSAVVEEVKKRGYKDVAIVSTIQDGMLYLRDLFAKSAPAKIVMNEEFASTETDFRSTVAKIYQLNPSGVYVLLLPPQTGLFARQLRDGGYTGEIFSAHQLQQNDELVAAKGALLGAWFVGDDSLGSGEFNKRYRTKFGTEPVIAAHNAYDVVHLIINGAAKGDLNGYLHSVKDFEGVLGTYSATSDNGFGLKAIIKVVTPTGYKSLY